MKLLLVDDSATMRKIVIRSLAQAGFVPEVVLEASNGVEALKVLRSHQVDLVLSDINMPEMSGLELLVQMKADQALASLPVVMVTSEGSPTIIEQAMSSGAAGHIQKPFNADKIKEVIGPLAA